MKPAEIIAVLRQIEQLAIGLQFALKHAPAEARVHMSRFNFNYQRRIAIQRTSWVMVGAIREAIKALEAK